jgi:hypothetical protein
LEKLRIHEHQGKSGESVLTNGADIPAAFPMVI